MQAAGYRSYGDWYAQGPLSPYVRDAGLVGGTISVIETMQPAGDMSDPAVGDLILMRTLSFGVAFDFDLGAGRFAGTERHGDFHLVAPDTATDIQVHAPHSSQFFALPAATCLALLEGEAMNGLDFGALHRQLFRSDLLNALCERLIAAIRRPAPPSRLFAESTSMAILAELALLAGNARKPRGGDVHDWRIRRTIDQLEARLGDDIGLTELAASVGLSPSHHAALFRAATGMPPHMWLVRRRIERACELLLDPHKPVTDIALRLGFASSQHFATTFRSHRGLSPSAWRRQRLS